MDVEYGIAEPRYKNNGGQSVVWALGRRSDVSGSNDNAKTGDGAPRGLRLSSFWLYAKKRGEGAALEEFDVPNSFITPTS